MSNKTPINDQNPPYGGDIVQLIKISLAEDVGAGDITSELLIPESARAEILFVAREKMVVCGGFVPELVYSSLQAQRSDSEQENWIAASPAAPRNDVQIEIVLNDGQLANPGDVIATATGSARMLLTGERVALNIMQRMCSVATLTRAYVDAVRGTKAIILDTRKTMPGMRRLDKYAVRMGGGQNHRMGLYDMVLVKDNHIALGAGLQASGIEELVKHLRTSLSALKPGARSLTPIVIECDTLAQVKEALAAMPDRILLDNMSPAELRQAVALVAGKVPLEASGGVSLETVKAIAETGVDYISVGKLTHSAPAVDIAADIKIQN